MNLPFVAFKSIGYFHGIALVVATLLQQPYIDVLVASTTSNLIAKEIRIKLRN
jgi:hypothetical protein